MTNTVGLSVISVLSGGWAGSRIKCKDCGEGRDAHTIRTFAADLRGHGGDPGLVTAACSDMSRSYSAGDGRHLPNAAITFDRFHVIQLANAALEEVRRAEVREKPALRNSRWMWLKDKHSRPRRQIHQHHELSRMHLRTGRAFRLKETRRDIFMTATPRGEADEQRTAWFRWTRRSTLPPFKRLALTLKAHWDGILNGFDSALSNRSAEAINRLIQAAKARARGYRKARNLIIMAYLIASHLSRRPASPCNTTSGDVPA